MKKIWNHIANSFALLIIRIVDILSFIAGAVCFFPLKAQLYLCDKYHMSSWYWDYLSEMLHDAMLPEIVEEIYHDEEHNVNPFDEDIDEFDEDIII